MRQVYYLSPTSISTWRRNKEEFYLQYLADYRPKRIPQTMPMSIGSAFDAYTKSWLHEILFGKGYDPKFEFKALFEAQVEFQNRDWALVNGKHAFECYKYSGALDSLLAELHTAIGKPRFELEIKGVVDEHREGVTKNLGGVCFLGKPDLFYINKHGTCVILDWKVNGWLSNYPKRPLRGYVKKRKWIGPKLQDWGTLPQHPEAIIQLFGGQLINVALYLETVESDWSRQLAIYSWLCGSDIGQEFIACIDQLACDARDKTRNFPDVEIYEHRLRVSSNHQWKVYAEAEEIWECVQSKHIFRDMSKEESDQKCRVLEVQAKALSGEGSENDKLFAKMARGL